MSNEELLSAFEKFLRVDEACRIATRMTTPARMLVVVRELAAAIDPVSLEKVTQERIKVFLRDKAPTSSARPLRLRDIRTKIEKSIAEVRFAEHEATMLCFSHFLRVLREHGAGL